MPVGESRDHPLANPFGPDSSNLEQVKLDPILVIVGGNELLKDRATDYATRLKELGKNIEYIEFEGKEHGFFTHDSYSEVAEEVVQILKRFMLENSK
ncbi:Alpha/Beta hydrolase fold [Sesbania bispinosa]|nr:Alpha/Beta hydrolase fold [Sesbania bispinosa]